MVERNETHPVGRLMELIKNQNFGEAIRHWRSHMNFRRKCAYRCEHHGREVTETRCGHCLENKLRTIGFKEAISGNADNTYSSCSEELNQWLST